MAEKSNQEFHFSVSLSYPLELEGLGQRCRWGVCEPLRAPPLPGHQWDLVLRLPSPPRDPVLPAAALPPL